MLKKLFYFLLGAAVVAGLFIGALVYTVNNAAAIFDGAATQLQTLDPANKPAPVIVDLVATQPPPPAVILQETAVPLPTYTPQPTYTPYPTQPPVKLIDDRGLPAMGPYSLDQVQQCQAIVANGHIDTLPSPQRELCEMYTSK